MFLTLILAAIAIVLLAVVSWILYTFKYKSISHIPGPLPIPIVGNMLEFWNYDEILPTLVNFGEKYGPITRIWQGCDPWLIITDRDMTEFFLRSPKYITKTDNYHFGRPWLGTGILAADGNRWQRKRKTITPAFHFKILEDYISIFDTSCDILIEILSTKVDQGICDIAPLIGSFTLDIIGETAMGAKINAQNLPKSEYVQAVHFMTSIVTKRTISTWKKFDTLFRFSNDYRKQNKACKVLIDLTIKMIRERRKQLLDCKEDEIDLNENKTKKTLFIDILLKTTVNGEPLSDEEIRDEVNNFMFGGQDTTAAALSLLMYELSNNRPVQNKVVEELRAIYGNNWDRPCTIQDTCEMKYMECVIKEMLRYYSPVPLISRKLTEDVEYNGTILPKGLSMLFLLYGMHKNPEMFDQPEVFNPDRFLSESTIKSYSFIPFSAGPRNCLGQKYAMYELKVTLAKVLLHFEFSPAGPGYELKLLPEMVMKSGNGVNVRISRREL